MDVFLFSLCNFNPGNYFLAQLIYWQVFWTLQKSCMPPNIDYSTHWQEIFITVRFLCQPSWSEYLVLKYYPLLSQLLTKASAGACQPLASRMLWWMQPRILTLPPALNSAKAHCSLLPSFTSLPSLLICLLWFGHLQNCNPDYLYCAHLYIAFDGIPQVTFVLLGWASTRNVQVCASGRHLGLVGYTLLTILPSLSLQ